jgi:hypothetical protein
MSWKNFTGYYVYTYLDENLKPYYVGMGCKKRVIAKHLYVSVPPFTNIVVEDNLTQQQAWDREIELIAQYGREHLGTGPLKNLTGGGPTQKSGWTHSPKTKEQISIKNTGKIRTLEHRENYRKPKTAEHSEKIKEVVQNLWNNPEYKEQRLAKIKEKSFAHKGKPWSPARREAYMKKQKIKVQYELA